MTTSLIERQVTLIKRLRPQETARDCAPKRNSATDGAILLPLKGHHNIMMITMMMMMITMMIMMMTMVLAMLMIMTMGLKSMKAVPQVVLVVRLIIYFDSAGEFYNGDMTISDTAGAT